MYSFGIVLLELVSGKSPTNDSLTGGLSLARWVQSAVPDKLVQVIDPQIIAEIFQNDIPKGSNPELDCVAAVLGVGLSCTTDSPDGRLSMKVAVGKLQAARNNLLKLVGNKSSFKH